MSEKYFLIGENRFNSLLTKPDIYDPEHLNVAKNDLSNILTNTKMDVSSKNALYNMALKRLIKKRKQVEEKPVKVEDKSLANVNKNLDQSLQKLANALNKPSFRQVPKNIRKQLSTNPLLQNVSPGLVSRDNSPLKETHNSFGFDNNSLHSDETQESDPVDEAAQQHSVTISDTDFDDPILSPPEPWEIPEIPASYLPNYGETRDALVNRTPVIRTRNSNAQINERKKEALADYMLNKPDYGFTEKGELVSPRSKKIVRGSSHKDIADYHISMPGKHTPPGYKKIQQMLTEDPEAQKIREDSKGRLKINKW